MKKSLIKAVVVFLILLAAAAVLCYFLPEKVPIHFIFCSKKPDL